MSPLLLDFLNELVEVEAEALLLAQTVRHLAETRIAATNKFLNWALIQGTASGIEKVYSGCETIMENVARRVDDSPIAPDGGWHIALLRRMRHPVPGIRPALLSTETYGIMEQLRAFRHRERNTYGSNLSWEKTLANASLVERLMPLFRSDLEALITNLDAPG